MSLDSTQIEILKECTEKDLIKNDRISDLPDDILIRMLSSLTLKQAGSTSVLSKRWRHVWAYVPSLNFYPCREYLDELYLRKASESEVNAKTRQENKKYLNWVDKAVTSHKADIIDEFRVKFHLSPKKYKEKIDNWFRIAMLKRVKSLELDFFPVQSYNLPSLSPSVPLAFLKLSCVNVTGEALEKLLHDSPNLEFLSVKFSESLVKLKVAGPALKLKSLKIYSCLKIKHLEISAPNLISFKYSGPHLLRFPIISTPKLTELSIGGEYGTHYLETFMGLSSIFSQIEVFGLSSVGIVNDISVKFPVGPRVKTLYINVEILLMEEELFRLVDLIQACPLLERFVLEGLKIGGSYPYHCEDMMVRKEICHHQHLKIVELHGFSGFEEEFNFAEYLIEMALPLEKIIIHADSEYEKYRIRGLEEANRLREVLKPGIHLEIH